MDIKSIKLLNKITLFSAPLLITALIFFAPLSVLAHAGHNSPSGSDRGIETINNDVTPSQNSSLNNGISTNPITVLVSGIRQSQNIDSRAKIDCDRVGTNKFEALGEAIMTQMHPGAQHELMDRMMGGEGSPSLAAMHTMMGKKYLACANKAQGANMMAGNMMMGSMMNGQTGPPTARNMMSAGRFSLAWVWMLFLLILIVALTVVLIQWLLKQRTGVNAKTALDILQERYAKGEIEQKEFVNKKKDLS